MKPLLQVLDAARVTNVAVLVALSACALPTEAPPDDKTTRIQSIDKLHSELVKATHQPESDALRSARAEARQVMEGGEGEEAFVRATWRLLSAARIGHSGLYSVDYVENMFSCSGYPLVPAYNLLHVTSAPSRDGFVITEAADDNPLRLRVGDVVVAIGAARGIEAMTHLVDSLPSCRSLAPSDSGRRADAAIAWPVVTRPGTPVEISSPSGTRRVVIPEIPVPTAQPVNSSRGGGEAPSVIHRSDGVAVLRVPSFQRVDHHVLARAVEESATARAVVIDVRGNPGGSYEHPAFLADALPGARRVAVMRCALRNGRGYELGPASAYGDPALDAKNAPFKKLPAATVVLVDGRGGSGTSVFVRFAALASNAKIVGVSDQGSYSNSPHEVPLVGPPSLIATIDTARCFDPATGEVVEGRPLEPHLHVDIDPADVVRGIDTQLEAAAKVALESELGASRTSP
jgi:C-terminal processing protease CtpA/Prc